MSFSDWIKTLD